MNWLESSSFSGLLSQAQKSIDKVLDIPPDDGKSDTQKSESVTSHSQIPKNKEKTRESKSASSWLPGADSFWGSFTQSVHISPKEDKQENNENSSNKADSVVQEQEGKAPQNVKNVLQKESKSPSKAMNLKRSSKKRALKKNVETSDGDSDERTKTGVVDQLDGKEEKKNGDLKDGKDDSLSECNPASGKSDGLVRGSNEDESNQNTAVHESRTIRTKSEEVLQMKEDTLTVKNSDVSEGEKMGGRSRYENERMEHIDVLRNDRNSKTGKFTTTDLKSFESTEKTETFNEISLQFNAYKRSVEKVNCAEEYAQPAGNENFEDNKDIDCTTKQEELVVTESGKNLNLLVSPPVATSTPQTVRKKEKLCHSISQLANFDDLLEESKQSKAIERVKSDVSVGLEDSNNEITTVKNDKEGTETEEQTDDSTSELLQIIEVRESKLVELSKENLSLQETNAVLRSQIVQLENLHKSEDAELEEMKSEFTKRIGESDAKLQVAAKERDLFKKQLEETQKCLSSDMERQVTEFQLLLQQKDEQIVQLMEEGEKLSKQILQRNNNIKKLRAKEKELNSANENHCTRLLAAETEIERLAEILKERDDHEKEQNDAIKKLNAYTKKQEELMDKQKIELEEYASKLPSLQTALDNSYKEITELNKVNAAKSNEVQEATLSVEMTAKEELRIALEKLKKESQRESDVLAMEVTDLQIQLSRSEQQAARREDNMRQEIADIQMRLQEAESRNQELTQSVSVATRPLLRQIENLQQSYGSQQTSWEKLEKNLTERLAETQSHLAAAQEKERAATERSLGFTSKVASLESQVTSYRQEKSRIEAEFELEKAKSETLEEYKSRESGKIEALKTMHSKQLETIMMEKSLLEQQLVVEQTKYESDQKKLTKLEEQLKSKERLLKSENFGEVENEDSYQQTASDRRRNRNSSSSSILSLSETMARSLPSGGTAVLEELRATIRHKEGELVSMQSSISTLEASRESLTEELTSLINANETLSKENQQLRNTGKSFQELQTKYNALLQMYGEKQEETEELKLDLQDIKNMYKAQIQELLSER